MNVVVLLAISIVVVIMAGVMRFAYPVLFSFREYKKSGKIEQRYKFNFNKEYGMSIFITLFGVFFSYRFASSMNLERDLMLAIIGIELLYTLASLFAIKIIKVEDLSDEKIFNRKS